MTRRHVICACLLMSGLVLSCRAMAETTYYLAKSDCTLIVENAMGETIQAWRSQELGTEIADSPELHPWNVPPYTYDLRQVGIRKGLDYHGEIFKDIDLVRNVGRTFWISSNVDDPQYSTFVSALTNPGSLYMLEFFTEITDTTGRLLTGGGGGNYIDGPANLAKGTGIGRIGLRIDSAYFGPNPDPSIPEPSTALSLLAGMSSLCALAVRRRGRVH